MVRILSLLLFTFLPFITSAQTFTQRLQEPTKGHAVVTVHHDNAIDRLVNGPGTAAANNAPAKNNATRNSATPKTGSTAKTAEQPAKANADNNSQTPGRTVTNDTTAAEHKNTYKTTGYRIQVFAGGNSRKDRQKAEQTGNQLRMLFPTESVYVHFYSPRWICRMGNYRTREEALVALQEVKKLGYAAATIVKGKITLQY